ARAVMHLWWWMGHVMGVEEQCLHSAPRRGLRDMYHFLRTSPPPDGASRVLAESLLASYGGTELPHAAALRGRLDIARHRSIATYLNGPAGMREPGLRPALPRFPARVLPAHRLLHCAPPVPPRLPAAVGR